jgi:hypothetical protein
MRQGTPSPGRTGPSRPPIRGDLRTCTKVGRVAANPCRSAFLAFGPMNTVMRSIGKRGQIRPGPRRLHPSSGYGLPARWRHRRRLSKCRYSFSRMRTVGPPHRPGPGGHSLRTLDFANAYVRGVSLYPGVRVREVGSHATLTPPAAARLRLSRGGPGPVSGSELWQLSPGELTTRNPRPVPAGSRGRASACQCSGRLWPAEPGSVNPQPEPGSVNPGRRSVGDAPDSGRWAVIDSESRLGVRPGCPA